MHMYISGSCDINSVCRFKFLRNLLKFNCIEAAIVSIMVTLFTIFFFPISTKMQDTYICCIGFLLTCASICIYIYSITLLKNQLYKCCLWETITLWHVLRFQIFGKPERIGHISGNKHPTVVMRTNFELASILIEILKLREIVISYILDGNNLDILMGGSTFQQVDTFCLLTTIINFLQSNHSMLIIDRCQNNVKCTLLRCSQELTSQTHYSQETLLHNNIRNFLLFKLT